MKVDDIIRVKGNNTLWKVTATRKGGVEAKTISEPSFDNAFRNAEVEKVKVF